MGLAKQKTARRETIQVCLFPYANTPLITDQIESFNQQLVELEMETLEKNQQRKEFLLVIMKVCKILRMMVKAVV